MKKKKRRHPGIGLLEWDERGPEWKSVLDIFSAGSVNFSIIAEGEWEDVDSKIMFEAGAAFLAWASEFEPKCRKRIARDLLDLYNQVWADDDPEEGPPPCTKAEFLAELRLTGLILYDSGSSTWIYSAGDLFAGHWIELGLQEGRSFRGPARLFG